MSEKEKLLKEARELGIVDVDVHGGSENTLEALELAIKLTKKHGKEVFDSSEEKRRAQGLNTYEQVQTSSAKT